MDMASFCEVGTWLASKMKHIGSKPGWRVEKGPNALMLKQVGSHPEESPGHASKPFATANTKDGRQLCRRIAPFPVAAAMPLEEERR